MRPWLIRRSRFPLQIPGVVLGTVTAIDHAAAELLGRKRFGGAVTAEPLPRRDPRTLDRAMAEIEVRRGANPTKPYPRRS